MNNFRVMPLEIKKMDDSKGTFEGYGSVFGVVDSYSDVVVRGAFKETLANRKASNIKMLWQHNADEPIGVYDDIYEDENGLFIRGRLLIDDVNRAKEAYALLKNGALDGLSIGYRINSDGRRMGDDGITYLTSLKLYEVSLVTFPANGDALVSTVKADKVKNIKSIRDFEEFLRDAGYSRSQATAIASKGYKAIDQSESDNELAVLNVINNLKQSLEDFTNASRSKSISR